MIIIEGLDGTGKTTLKEGLLSYGFRSFHFDYDIVTSNIFDKYCKIISGSDKQTVLDRSYISEIVYGNVIRKHSRISYSQLDELACQCAKKGSIIVYLHAPKNVLLSRRLRDRNDTKMLQEYYDKLCEEYVSLMQRLSQYLPVLWLDTTDSQQKTLDSVCKFYQEQSFDLVYAGNISRDKYIDTGNEYWGGSGFHSAIASALFGEKKVGVISGVGEDFDEEIFRILGIININGKIKGEKCNVFQTDSVNSSFKLSGECYLPYPSITKRIFTHHLHISLRKGVPIEDIISNPMVRFDSLSVDVMYSSIDYAIDMICRFKEQISMIFCNLKEYKQIKKHISTILTIVTNEHRPVMLWKDGILQQMFIVPFCDKIIRTDGAGDSFIGGFLSIPRRMNLRDNIVRGIAMSWAAVACERRYKLTHKELSYALKMVEDTNTKSIKKVPRHIIVIGNPCSGKTAFTDYMIDYFSNYYISIDDYGALYDVFMLDDGIRSNSSIIETLNDFKLKGKAKRVTDEYLNLYERSTLDSSLYTILNSNGGHDICRPELWDIILEESLLQCSNEKNYIFQLSRGTDQQYMCYKSISKYHVYDAALLTIIRKLNCPDNEILIVNLTASYETRILRNKHRALYGGHYVSDVAMKNIYAEDILAQIYFDKSGIFTIDTFDIPYITIDNSLDTDNISKRFFEITKIVLDQYNKLLGE